MMAKRNLKEFRGGQRIIMKNDSGYDSNPGKQDLIAI